MSVSLNYLDEKKLYHNWLFIFSFSRSFWHRCTSMWPGFTLWLPTTSTASSSPALTTSSHSQRPPSLASQPTRMTKSHSWKSTTTHLPRVSEKMDSSGARGKCLMKVNLYTIIVVILELWRIFFINYKPAKWIILFKACLFNLTFHKGSHSRAKAKEYCMCIKEK